MSSKSQNTRNKIEQHHGSTLPIVPMLNPSIDLRNTPNKGLGLFATTQIPQGTYLIQEEALLKDVNPTLYKHKQDFIATIETQIFRTLSDDNRSAFLSLSRAEHLVNTFLDDSDDTIERQEGDVDEAFTLSRRYLSALACATYHTNAFGCGVYANIARINHSCRPNCEMKGDNQQGIVFAIRDIEAGEEITLSYVGGLVGDLVQAGMRFRHLLHYGFVCECGSCCWVGRGVSEKRRGKIRRLGEDVGFLLGRLRTETPMSEGPLAASVAVGAGSNFNAAYKAMVELNVLADQEELNLYEVFRLYMTCRTLARVFNEVRPTIKGVNFCIWWDKQMERFPLEFWGWTPQADR